MKSIFVSSTFKDMHNERDILNREIEPKLNYLLSKYNKMVRISDLRWGIDTSSLSEQEAHERVLSVCFDEIERCRPYIIILLGDRYGYVPKGEDISVTHMEIIRGALNSSCPENVFIYIRSADYTNMPTEQSSLFCEANEESRVKLEKLKAELLEKFPSRCKTYTARWDEEAGTLVSEDFFDLVYGDLSKKFEDECGKSIFLSPLHKQIEETEEQICDTLKYAYINEEKLRLHAEGALASLSPYGIIGDAGEGKSIFMSLLCLELRKRGESTYAIFCGDNGFSASCRNASELVLYAMTCAIGEDYDFVACAQLEYDDILGKISEMRKKMSCRITVLFDAIDKADGVMLQFIMWLKRYASDCVRVIFSSRKTEEISSIESSLTLSCISYNQEDLRQIATALLKRHGKSLNGELIEELSKSVSTPLEISLLALRLISLDRSDFEEISKLGSGITAINAHMKSIIDSSPKNASDLIRLLTLKLIRASSDKNFSSLLLCFIAFSDSGLPVNDLRQIFDRIQVNWVELDFVDFMSRFSFYLRISDSGRIDISHDIIRECLRFDLSKPFGDMIYGALTYYYGFEKELDAFSVRTFFDAVLKSKPEGFMVKFLKNHNGLLHKFSNGREAEASLEIKRCIRKILYRHGSKPLFDALCQSRSFEELVLAYSAISSSIMSSNDYIPLETALDIVNLILSLPIQYYDELPGVAENALISCEGFLKRHDAGEDGVKIIEHFANIIKEKRAKLGKRGNIVSDDFNEDLKRLGDESTPLDEKILIVTSLSNRARAYAQKPETAQSAIDISLRIIELFPEIDDGGLSREIHLANEHTTLGLAYKVLKQWEKALEHDYISADIYKKIYESSHGSDAFTKYRERVFNIANVIEAWAIDEEDNLSLWQRSCDAFDEAYRLDMLAIGSNANERDIIRCSSTIQSYGSSLIKVGRIEDGLSKYREAVSIVEDIAKNRPNPEIYVDFCITIMEIIHQLTLINRYTEAREFALNLSKSITYIFDSENKLCIEKINELLPHISNALNERLSELFAVSDLENSIWICRLLCDVYLAFLKIAPDEVRYNIIILTKNIADMYFLKIQDYELAYREYMHLFEIIEQYGLITPDESGKYNENLNARLGDPYIRIMVCLERLGRIDEAKAVASEMGRFIEYILSITYSYESDPLILAYMTAMGMTKFSREMSICLVEQGLELAKVEPFRKKSSLGTVAKMTMLLNNLRNDA